MIKTKGQINPASKKQLARLAIAFLGFFLVYLLAIPALGHEVGATMAVIFLGVLLWVLEPLPLSMTCFIIIITFMLTKTASAEIVLSGFSATSTFLILCGLLMAKGISSTNLAERAAYKVMIRFGASPRSSLLALLVTMQFLALFVPATAVKATLMLPVTFSLGKAFIKTGSNRNVHKMLLLGLAYGTHITALSVLPSAVGNVLTAEMLNSNLGLEMTYTRWLAYFFPVSAVLIPCTWLILLKVFPPGKDSGGEANRNYLVKELSSFGPLSAGEKRLIQILCLTVLLWMTDFIHGWPTFIPAMVAVVLMGLPGIGFANWQNLLKIRWENVIMVGTILSMGLVFINTGAAGYLASFLIPPFIAPLVLAATTAGLITFSLLIRIYHLFIGNVGTMIVIMVPIVIEVFQTAGLDPLFPVLLTGSSGLLAFLLIIQTMPGVIVYSTGELTAVDFLKAGLPLTLASVLALALAARFWWPFIQNIYGP